MTQKRDRIVAWAVQTAAEGVRQEAIRQVTARLKEGLPQASDALAFLDLRTTAKDALIKWFGDQLDRAVFEGMAHTGDDDELES